MTPLSGDWALVTGASSGIGREFAVQLAAAGMNAVLVARREERLHELANELRARHGRDSLVVAVDLGTRDSPATIRERCVSAGVEIRLLVNNAASGRWGAFEQTSVDAYSAMLAVNVESVVAMCHVFFPQLRRHATSAIINVSSQAAYQPVPYMAVYAASKAFVQSFSVALYEEWRRFGISVQCLVPGPTASEFDERSGAYESAVKGRDAPALAVRAALTHLGRDEPVVSSARGLYKQRIFAGLFPPRRVAREVGKMFRPPRLDQPDQDT